MAPYTIFNIVFLKQIHKSISIGILFAFLANMLGPIPVAQADEFRLPAPGVMVPLSLPVEPPMLIGLKVHPDNPFQFDFIMDKGGDSSNQERLKEQSTKLIKYFLASLTIPEKDLWVNLSPYEKNRIIPYSFGLTEMGRDLLAEDYMLKQITASLIYPEDAVGRKFWKRVYEEAFKKFGSTNVPVNTFNKVWIVPADASVYENAKLGTAYVVKSTLKVMLEEDYLSLAKHEGSNAPQQSKDTSQLGSDIVREIVIPELTREVNENENFARLRQVYNSLILATWYKDKIKNSLLSEIYADKNKIAGVNNDDPQEKQKIYQRYLRAFKQGVYNYIKEDIDPATQEKIPRKYFSGGLALDEIKLTPANDNLAALSLAREGKDRAMDVTAGIDKASISKTSTVPIVNPLAVAVPILATPAPTTSSAKGKVMAKFKSAKIRNFNKGKIAKEEYDYLVALGFEPYLKDRLVDVKETGEKILRDPNNTFERANIEDAGKRILGLTDAQINVVWSILTILNPKKDAKGKLTYDNESPEHKLQRQMALAQSLRVNHSIFLRSIKTLASFTGAGTSAGSLPQWWPVRDETAATMLGYVGVDGVYYQYAMGGVLYNSTLKYNEQSKVVPAEVTFKTLNDRRPDASESLETFLGGEPTESHAQLEIALREGLSAMSLNWDILPLKAFFKSGGKLMDLIRNDDGTYDLIEEKYISIADAAKKRNKKIEDFSEKEQLVGWVLDSSETLPENKNIPLSQLKIAAQRLKAKAGTEGYPLLFVQYKPDMTLDEVTPIMDAGIPRYVYLHGYAKKIWDLLTDFKWTGPASIPHEVIKTIIYQMLKNQIFSVVGISGNDPDMSPLFLKLAALINGHFDEVEDAPGLPVKALLMQLINEVRNDPKYLLAGRTVKIIFQYRSPIQDKVVKWLNAVGADNVLAVQTDEASDFFAVMNILRGSHAKTVAYGENAKQADLLSTHHRILENNLKRMDKKQGVGSIAAAAATAAEEMDPKGDLVKRMLKETVAVSDVAREAGSSISIQELKNRGYVESAGVEGRLKVSEAKVTEAINGKEKGTSLEGPLKAILTLSQDAKAAIVTTDSIYEARKAMYEKLKSENKINDVEYDELMMVLSRDFVKYYDTSKNCKKLLADAEKAFTPDGAGKSEIDVSFLIIEAPAEKIKFFKNRENREKFLHAWYLARTAASAIPLLVHMEEIDAEYGPKKSMVLVNSAISRLSQFNRFFDDVFGENKFKVGKNDESIFEQHSKLSQEDQRDARDAEIAFFNRNRILGQEIMRYSGFLIEIRDLVKKGDIAKAIEYFINFMSDYDHEVTGFGGNPITKLDMYDYAFVLMMNIRAFAFIDHPRIKLRANISDMLRDLYIPENSALSAKYTVSEMYYQMVKMEQSLKLVVREISPGVTEEKIEPMSAAEISENRRVSYAHMMKIGSASYLEMLSHLPENAWWLQASVSEVRARWVMNSTDLKAPDVQKDSKKQIDAMLKWAIDKEKKSDFTTRELRFMFFLISIAMDYYQFYNDASLLDEVLAVARIFLEQSSSRKDHTPHYLPEAQQTMVKAFISSIYMVQKRSPEPYTADNPNEKVAVFSENGEYAIENAISKLYSDAHDQYQIVQPVDLLLRENAKVKEYGVAVNAIYNQLNINYINLNRKVILVELDALRGKIKASLRTIETEKKIKRDLNEEAIYSDSLLNMRYADLTRKLDNVYQLLETSLDKGQEITPEQLSNLNHDKAQLSDIAVNKPERRGGIDLTPANMHLKTRNNGDGAIKFHMDQAQLAKFQNAPGFVPVIIHIQPVKNLKSFFGLTISN